MKKLYIAAIMCLVSLSPAFADMSVVMATHPNGNVRMVGKKFTIKADGASLPQYVDLRVEATMAILHVDGRVITCEETSTPMEERRCVVGFNIRVNGMATIPHRTIAHKDDANAVESVMLEVMAGDQLYVKLWPQAVQITAVLSSSRLQVKYLLNRKRDGLYCVTERSVKRIEQTAKAR